MARDVLSHEHVTQDLQQPPAGSGGATAVVLLVGLCTLALTSLLTNPRDLAPPDPEAAAAAIALAADGAQVPVALLTDLRREELVWYAAGSVAPAPDWMARPADYVAISHEPGGLPDGGDTLGEVREWAARRYGTPATWTWGTALRTASVDADAPCAGYRMGRFRCGSPGWEWVGPATVVVQGKPETCLWMHPLDGRPLRVRFPSVPTGQITGRYAFSDAAAQTPGGGPVDLSVWVGAREALHRKVASRKGWAPFRVAVAGEDLTFEVRAKKSGRRHFCVQLEHAL